MMVDGFTNLNACGWLKTMIPRKRKNENIKVWTGSKKKINKNWKREKGSPTNGWWLKMDPMIELDLMEYLTDTKNP